MKKASVCLVVFACWRSAAVRLLVQLSVSSGGTNQNRNVMIVAASIRKKEALHHTLQLTGTWQNINTGIIPTATYIMTQPETCISI
jgi:hypothetical protein